MRKRLFRTQGARLRIAVLVTILDECRIANALTEVSDSSRDVGFLELIRNSSNTSVLSNFDFESTPSARVMRWHRRHFVALGGGSSVFGWRS